MFLITESIKRKKTADDISKYFDQSLKYIRSTAAAYLYLYYHAEQKEVSLEDIVDSRMQKNFKENDERKNRSNNLVFFNVQMSKSEKAEERKSHDIEILQSVFKILGK